MELEAISRPERSATVVTQEHLFVVDIGVLSQSASVSEFTSTFFAFVRFLIRMDSLVSGDITPFFEPLAAVATSQMILNSFSFRIHITYNTPVDTTFTARFQNLPRENFLNETHHQ